MAKYPEIFTGGFRFIEKVEIDVIGGKTLISEFEDMGAEKRRRKQLYPKRNVTISYQGIEKANAKTLWQFFIDRGGKYEAFNFFYSRSNTYAGEYIGQGDSVTKAFNTPSRAATSVTVYKDGSALALNTEYQWSGEAGTDGADKIYLPVVPVSGERLTMDFTGVLKVRARFDEDVLSFEDFLNQIITTGVKIVGLLNE
jgi:hypothetical protein